MIPRAALVTHIVFCFLGELQPPHIVSSELLLSLLLSVHQVLMASWCLLCFAIQTTLYYI